MAVGMATCAVVGDHASAETTTVGIVEVTAVHDRAGDASQISTTIRTRARVVICVAQCKVRYGYHLAEARIFDARPDDALFVEIRAVHRHAFTDLFSGVARIVRCALYVVVT
jgi:hypothetical protein